MKKAAAERKTTTPKEDDIEKLLESQAAKSQFYGATINLSWRLALIVLIPVIAGVKLDEKFNKSPSFVLAGLMIAAFGAAATIWSTVQEVNQLQAEDSKKSKRKKKSA
jgi:F0F1-type ATP synthase assembly protein I